MEDRQDLINLLLDGLEAPEREHVKKAIREITSAKLQRLRQRDLAAVVVEAGEEVAS